MEDIHFSVGICAYNEAGNIEKCIRSIMSQKFNGFVMDTVTVVSSASTDGTDDIVRGLMPEFPLLKLIVQKERGGKNSAINEFLDDKKTEIAVIVNADNVLKNENTLQKLLEPFTDEKIGMVGGHPITVNTTKTVAGFSSTMIWSLHHHIAMESPKIGELVAYRDIGSRLPGNFQSDEDIIRFNIEKSGLTVKYAPEAETLIRGPETVKDLVKQRVRVNIGQSYMVKQENFYNPSRDYRVLFKVISETVKDLGFHPFKYIAAVTIELYCRSKGKRYVKQGKHDMSAWDPVSSTKKV